MSGRQGSTFNKLQKERARQQRQREKIERRQQRKLEKAAQKEAGGAPADEQQTALAVHDELETGQQ